MAHILFFLCLLALCCGYALWKGGAAERAAAGMLLTAALLTFVAQGLAIRTDLRVVQWGIFIVDLLLLCGLFGLSIAATRWWPIWLTGLQLLQAAAHLARLVSPGSLMTSYATFLAIMAYPMLLLLAWGTWRHRLRLKKFGSDPSWRRSSSPHPEQQPIA